jgi:hypothetical protein
MVALKGPIGDLLAVGVALTGCAVGPDFERPAAPDVSGYSSSTMLEVGAAGGLPGFQEGELSLYLARHMTDARLTEWRYELALGEGLPANYVLWRFRLKPYKGGEVYSHHPFHPSRETFGALYSVTLEARLYLNGEYQTLVEGQALMDGPNDPHLALAVTNLTRNLLGPSGAYHRIDTEPHRAAPTR